MADQAHHKTASALAAEALPAWRTLRRELPVWLADNEHSHLQWWLTQQAAQRAQKHGDLLAPALGLALAAWQRHPCDPRFLNLLQTAQDSVPALQPPARTMIRALGTSIGSPPDAEAFHAARHSPKRDAGLEYALARLDRTEEVATWLFVGFEHCLETGHNNGATALLERFRDLVPAGPLHSLADRLDAERELYLGHPGRAEELARALDPACWGWWRGAALARLERARGDVNAAARRLAALWRTTPWHLNLVLTLHDLILPPEPGPMRAGKADTAVCIHAWNKAHELDRTLRSLSRAELGGALVAVVDNGSEDDTHQVLDAARERFAKGRFLAVRLPVNIGAPAARNWLLSLPEVRRARAVAFLDDDMEPPAHWLDALLDAASCPGAGTAGCLVTDADPPHAVQTGEVHLLPREMCRPNFTDLEERIFVSTPSGERDLGLWAYRRRCASVTGRCHLLTRASLDAQGGFDVRFTPSRFDDLERDLRGLLGGRPAIFDGRLAVRHRQGSGPRQTESTGAHARVMGNKIKLERLFTGDDAQDMLRRQWDMLSADLEARLAALGPALDDKGL